MTHAPHSLLNPCSLEAHEQTPAKIWELLRRNRDFRKVVDRLAKLDAKERSDLHGALLKDELFNEGDLLGLNSEWSDWLAYQARQPARAYKSTYFYHRRDYMESLVSLIYPRFKLAQLLAKPAHRTHGKKYERKRRNE